MNTSAKGSRNERKSREVLEAAGYNVTRAVGSMGCWDLIAIGSTDLVLCQVKTRDWPGMAETETLKMFPTPANCRKLIHRWRDRHRLPDTREL
jgi:Holliday junction resolvase